MGRDSVIHGIYCGSTLPSSITSESNTLRIEFNSDNSVQKTGFHAHFFTGNDDDDDYCIRFLFLFNVNKSKYVLNP